jgi:hypothetical protein
MTRLFVACAGLALALAAATPAHAAPKAAVFPLELIDTSLEGEISGPRADETSRLALATEELRRLAAREAGYELVDLGAIMPEIESSAPLYKCNGCEVELARRAGADIAITAAVRKFSPLLLSLHIYVTDVGTGNLTKMYRVDIRGNTDESWLRGVRRLVAQSLMGG